MADSDSARKGQRLVSLGRAVALRAGERLLVGVKGAIQSSGDKSLKTDPELPVVARLVVEIRSDGSRTVARGVLEDTSTHQTAAVRAEGTTPAQLARSLAATLFTLPVSAARMARTLKKAKSRG
jgi:hypothetical protein